VIAIVTLMAMALLPLSMHRHPCHHQDGDAPLVTLALLPLICDSIVALVVMALLPSSSWNWLIINVVALVTPCLPSSWHCHPQCAGVFAIVPMAIVALVTMVLSQLLMCRCL
jgi:Zn-dependent protease